MKKDIGFELKDSDKLGLRNELGLGLGLALLSFDGLGLDPVAALCLYLLALHPLLELVQQELTRLLQ